MTGVTFPLSIILIRSLNEQMPLEWGREELNFFIRSKGHWPRYQHMKEPGII